MTPPRAPAVGTSQKAAEAAGDQGLRVQVLFDAAGHAAAGSVLRQAYDIAAACHDGQLRFSGDSYITHPVEVALICQDLGMGPAVQCAALLHDVLIDTAYSTVQFRRDFSSEIAGLVEEVTRLDRFHYLSTAEAKDQVQAVRDPRVLIIKLADRLHNMRTLRYVPLSKQQRKSYEALELFAPLLVASAWMQWRGNWRTWRIRLSPNISKTRRHSQRSRRLAPRSCQVACWRSPQCYCRGRAGTGGWANGSENSPRCQPGGAGPGSPSRCSPACPG
jgi:hypothetical protein